MGSVVTAPVIEPDVEQAAEAQARRLLELAGAHTRAALQFPDEVEALRGMVAELLLEVGFLRHENRVLAERVEVLEKRWRGGR